MIVILLSLVMAMFLMVSLTAHAQASRKTVRVGWYKSPFNTVDQFGRRSGYAYDYQQKIAAYTGWNYEYVEGSWPELLQMLITGKIDLMSDVSYTDERAKSMLFSSLPMGEEVYYIYISPDNKEINRDDLATFNGKKAGVNKGSVQAGLFRKWAEANGVQAELIEMTEGYDESLAMLNRDEIRALAENKWEQVSVSLGMAEYNSQSDTSIDDVIHRADKTMYENKHARKEKNFVQ